MIASSLWAIRWWEALAAGLSLPAAGMVLVLLDPTVAARRRRRRSQRRSDRVLTTRMRAW